MINNITAKYFSNLSKVKSASEKSQFGFSSNPLKPLEKDTVSFKGALFKRDRNGRYCQEKTMADGSKYQIIYYEDINRRIKPDGNLPYPPLNIEFEKPTDIFAALDVCDNYLYNCATCEMYDRNQINTLKEFISETGTFKDEKIKSMVDAMHSTLVVELEGDRVLKMTKNEPFAKGRPFEPSFDIPLFSDVYKYKDYYIFVQEKADTEYIENYALDSVIERIIEAGYKPYDIEGNELQIGWSELKQDYMLIDSECAQMK